MPSAIMRSRHTRWWMRPSSRRYLRSDEALAVAATSDRKYLRDEGRIHHRVWRDRMIADGMHPGVASAQRDEDICDPMKHWLSQLPHHSGKWPPVLHRI